MAAPYYVYNPDDYLVSNGLNVYIIAYSGEQYNQNGGAFRNVDPVLGILISSNTDALLDFKGSAKTVTVGGNFSDPDEYNFSFIYDDFLADFREDNGFQQSKSTLNFREGGTVNFIAFTGDKGICATDGSPLSDKNISFLVKNIYTPAAGTDVKYADEFVKLGAYGISASSDLEELQYNGESIDKEKTKTSHKEFDKALTFETDFSAKFDVTATAILEGMTDGGSDLSNVSYNMIHGVAVRAKNIHINGNFISDEIKTSATLKTTTASYDFSNIVQADPVYVDGIDINEQRAIYYYTDGDFIFCPKYQYISYLFSSGSAASNGTIYFDWNNGSPQISYYPESLLSRHVRLYIGTDGKYRFAEDFDWDIYNHHFLKGELVDAESGGIDALPTDGDTNDFWGDTWKRFVNSTTGTKDIHGNQVSSVGLWVEDDLQVDGQFDGNITVSSNENMFFDLAFNLIYGNGPGTTGYTSEANIRDTSLNNNTISSYGLYSKNGTITLNEVTEAAKIRAEADHNKFAGERDSSDGWVRADSSPTIDTSMSGNRIESIGIKGQTLTVNGIFGGEIVSHAEGNSFYLNDIKIDQKDKEAVMNNSEEAAGIHVYGDLTTTDRFGGTITVNHSAETWDNIVTKSVFTYTTAGIFADGNLTVNAGKGTFDTTITVTSDLKCTVGKSLTGPDAVYGVKTNIFKAEAFTGSVSIDEKTEIQSGASTLILNKLSNYGLYATAYKNGYDKTFDILGTITIEKGEGDTTTNYGVYGSYISENPDLRFAGTITVTDPEFDYAFERSGTNSETGSVILASSANIQGKLDFLYGRNIVYVDSNARLDGDVTTQYGTRGIEFVLNRFGGLGKAADEILGVNATSAELNAAKAIVHSYGRTLATSGLDLAMNLNAAANGTYVLFENLTEEQINKAWKGLSVTFKYDRQENLKSIVDGNGEIVTSIGNINLHAFSREKDTDGTYQICLEVNGIDEDAPLTTDAVLSSGDNTSTISHDNTTQAVFDSSTHTLEIKWGLTTNEKFLMDPDNANIRFELEYWKDDVCEEGQSIVINIDAKDSKYFNQAAQEWRVKLENVYDNSIVKYRIRAVRGDASMPNSLSSIGAWTDEYTKDTTVDPTTYKIGTIQSTNVADPSGEPGVTSAITELQWYDAASTCEAGFQNYVVQFFFSSELYDDTDKSSEKLSKIWEDYDAGTSSLTVYAKTTTTNKVLLSGLDETQYVYWRVKAVDLKGNSSDWRIGQTFIENREDKTAPLFPDPKTVPGIPASVETLDDIFSMDSSKWFLGTDEAELTVKWYNIALDYGGDVSNSGIYQYVFTICEDGTTNNIYRYVPGREADYAKEISLVLSGEDMPAPTKDYSWNIHALDFATLSTPDDASPSGFIYGDKTAPETTVGQTTVTYQPLNIPYAPGTAFSGEQAKEVKNELGQLFTTTRVNVNFSIDAEDVQRSGLSPEIDYNISGVDKTSYVIHFTDPENEEFDDEFVLNSTGGSGSLDGRNISYQWTGNTVNLQMDAVSRPNKWYFTLKDNVGNEAKSSSVTTAVDTMGPTFDKSEFKSEMVGGTGGNVGIRVYWTNAEDPTQTGVGASGLSYYELQLYRKSGETYGDSVIVIADQSKTDFYSYVFENIEYGEYMWSIKAYDCVGNPSIQIVKEDVVMESLVFDSSFLYEPVVNGEEYDFSVDFQWAPAYSTLTDPTTYTVSYRLAGASEWTVSGSTTETTYTITSEVLSAQKGYEWMVEAKNSDKSPAKDAIGKTFMTPSVSPLPDPLSLSLTAKPLYVGSSFTVPLNWEIEAGEKTGNYSLLYAEAGSDKFTEVKGDISETSITWNASGKYKIVAEDKNYQGIKRESNVVTALKDTTDPKFIGEQTAKYTANANGYTFTWSKAKDQEGGDYEVMSKMKEYILEFSTDESFTDKSKIKEIPANLETSLTLSNSELKSYGLSSGDYYWRVRAVDNAGNSTLLKGSSSLDVDTVGPERKSNLTTMSKPTITVEYNMIKQTPGRYDISDVRDPKTITVTFDASNNTYTDGNKYQDESTKKWVDDRNGRYDDDGNYDCFTFEIATDLAFTNIVYSTANDYYEGTSDDPTKFGHNTLTLSTDNNGIARLAGYGKNQVFYWRIRAVDTLGNYADEYEYGTPFTLSDLDIQYDNGTYAPIQDLYTNPTKPMNFTVAPYIGTDESLKDSTYTFRWNPSSDAFGIVLYEIMQKNVSTKEVTYRYVDASLISKSRVAARTFKDFTSGDYQFTIRAYDGSGKMSSWSETISLSVYTEHDTGDGRTGNSANTLDNESEDSMASYKVNYTLESKTLGASANSNEIWFKIGGANSGDNLIYTNGLLNFKFTNVNSKLKITLYSRSKGVMKSFTISKAQGGISNFIYNYSQFSDLVYIQVQNLNKKTYDVTFNMDVDLEYFPTTDLGPDSFSHAELYGAKYLDTTEITEKEEKKKIGTTSFTEWVGINDPVDYWMIVGGSKGDDPNTGFLKKGITVSGVQAKLKLSLYVKESNGSYRKLASKTITKDSTVFANTMVDKYYFVVVESGDNGAGKQNSYYTLTVNEEIFPNNHDSQYAPTDIELGKKLEKQWVGYGDTKNYYQFTVTEDDGDGVFQIDLNLDLDLNLYKTKVTASLYNVADDGSISLISQQVKVKGNKTNIFVKSTPCLEAGKSYMVIVDAGTVKKASQNTYFDIKVTETETFKFKQEENQNNSFNEAITLQSEAGFSLNGWVGFNDTENYYQFQYEKTSIGKIRPKVKVSSGKVTTTFYDSSFNVVKEKQMVVGETYYLKVSATDEKKYYNNNFVVTMQYYK